MTKEDLALYITSLEGDVKRRRAEHEAMVAWHKLRQEHIVAMTQVACLKIMADAMARALKPNVQMAFDA